MYRNMSKTQITYFTINHHSDSYCYQHDTETRTFTIGEYNRQTNEVDEIISYDIYKIVDLGTMHHYSTYFLMIHPMYYNSPLLSKITLTRFDIQPSDDSIISEDIISLYLDDIIDVTMTNEYEYRQETGETVKFLEATREETNEDGEKVLEKVRIAFTTTNGGHYPTLEFV
jgi:hypothetical protein